MVVHIVLCLGVKNVKIYELAAQSEVFLLHNQRCSITDRSKAILLWWFLLFYVLVFKIFCAVGALCMLSYF